MEFEYSAGLIQPITIKIMIQLYHFCSKRHIESIRESGLIYGKIPVFSNKGNLKGFYQPVQWLTYNSHWDQSWCRNSSLSYKRNDYRITMEFIQENDRLFQWLEFCEQPKLKNSKKELNSFGDPENWFVFLGVILPNHFSTIEKNPNIK